MKEFFEHFTEDNISNNKLYWVLGIIAITLLAKKYLSHYIAKFFFILFKKIGRTPLEEPYYKYLIKPLQLFIVGILIVFSLEKISLRPYLLNYSLYGSLTVGRLLQFFSSAIVICLFIWLLLKISDYLAVVLEERANKTEGYDDNQLVIFFRDFFKVVIIIIGVLMILKYALGHPIGNLLTGLSIVGAAIALAAKESLENLIASFIIFFDKPFSVGHTVKIQKVEGVVEKIGLRSTRIRTFDKTYVTVPNKQMVDSIVDNVSLRTKRKYTGEIMLAKTTDPNKLVALVPEIVAILSKYGLPNQSAAYISEISMNGIKLAPIAFFDVLSETEFQTLKQKINVEILNLLHKENIQLAEAK